LSDAGQGRALPGVCLPGRTGDLRTGVVVRRAWDLAPAQRALGPRKLRRRRPFLVSGPASPRTVGM